MPLANNPEDDRKIADLRSRVARGETVPIEDLKWAYNVMRADRRSAAASPSKPKPKAGSKKIEGSAADILDGLLG